MLLLHHCRCGLGITACLPLSQSLVCQTVLESLDLGICIGKLSLELITGRKSANHSGLGSGEGTGGFRGLRRLVLGLFGEIGRRDGRGVVSHGLLAGGRCFVVSTGGSVGGGFLIVDLYEFSKCSMLQRE